MKFFISRQLVFLALALTTAFGAQDPSIDRLLGKLPPPEKFVDPAINDPLAKKMSAAGKAKNFGAALDASRQLAGRYPKSVGAQLIHGMLALELHRFPEASAAFRKTLSLQPDFVAGHVGLGLAEISQQHYRPAFSSFQQVTRLAPKAEVGWIGSSACAEQMGRRQESLEYARRAAVVPPSSIGAWYQLAREESLFGNKQAAATALARATKLQRNASSHHSSR
jgi:tetratricopeptide (TPR) repeat protein